VGDGFNLVNLKREILKRSESDIRDAAKLEWNLASVYDADEPQRCLCDHYPIVEVCIIRNRKTGLLAEVGNVCVTKFLGINADKIFGAIKRVKSDIDRALNPEAIELFYELKILNDWERKFYLDTWRKNAGLSVLQLGTRQKVNRKVLANMARAEAALR